MIRRLVLLTLLAHSYVSYAQSNFNVGFKGGIGYSGWHDEHKNLEPGHTIAHQFTSARMIGVLTSYKLPYRLSANLEVNYTESGSKHVDQWSGVTHWPTGEPYARMEKVIYSISQVGAPLSISYDFLHSNLTPYAQIGLSLSFIQKGTREFQYYLSTTGQDSDEEEDLALDRRKNKHLRFSTPFVGAFGLRVMQRLSLEASITIGGIFWYSLVPDDSVCSDICGTEELSYNNRVIMFAAAYNIMH